jgi:hypothetical protein
VVAKTPGSAEVTIDYNGRVFRSVSNSGSGDVGEETLFHYQQRGSVVWATYAGGAVEFGTLVATVSDTGILDTRYSHVKATGELATGVCVSTPEVLSDGRMRLHETWQWTSGDLSTGQSVIEEVIRAITDRNGVTLLQYAGPLAQIDWGAVNLTGANLRGTDLTGSYMEGSHLNAADLAGANLYWVTLNGADLRDANLQGACLRGARLRGVNFRGADLSGADLTPNNLAVATDLTGADLTGARLNGTKLGGILWDASTIFPEGFIPESPATPASD